MGVTRFIFELYLLKERPLRMPCAEKGVFCELLLYFGNEKFEKYRTTSSTIQTPYHFIKTRSF